MCLLNKNLSVAKTTIVSHKYIFSVFQYFFLLYLPFRKAIVKDKFLGLLQTSDGLVQGEHALLAGKHIL